MLLNLLHHRHAFPAPNRGRTGLNLGRSKHNYLNDILQQFGIKELYCVAGGSMGGMEAMQFAISYPDFVKSTILIATTSRLSPQAIAFNAVGRNSIISDPAWNNGDYYDKNEHSSTLG